MDVAVINWKDSHFEKDTLYEDFNAPQWIDFSNDNDPVDDEAWFCRPDCNHPKTVEDFFRERSPGSSKLQRSAAVSEIPRSGDRNRRDAAVKNRGFPSTKDSKSTKNVEDDENQDPNFSTPPVNKAKSIKDIIKSSSEKNHFQNVSLQKEETLKKTSSARNLFAGRDILNQVTEFCHELKRLATKTREIGVLQESQSQSQSQNERKPLLEVKQEKYEGIEKHDNVKEKLTKKKTNDESENSPITLNMKNIRSKDEHRLLQIRTNPPSPQCFNAKQKATPPKPFGLRPQRGIVEEIEGTSSKEVKKEAKGLDVFWLFKPCTLSR